MKVGFVPKSKDDWRLLLHIAKIIRLCDKTQLRKLVLCGELLLDRHPSFYDTEHYTPSKEDS